MKLCLWAVAFAAGLMAVAPVTVSAAETMAPYALLFKEGTLDALPKDRALIYQRKAEIPANPDLAQQGTGAIRVGFPEAEPGQAELRFGPDMARAHVVGLFPASVGNPLIMYHMETVVRDMAQLTGGSQFYIRNRMKDAMTRPTEIESLEVETPTGPVAAEAVVLHPFAGDPNAARMQGFADLEIRVVMSEAVPGWYHSLLAQVPDGQGGVRYRAEIDFQSEEGAE